MKPARNNALHFMFDPRTNDILLARSPSTGLRYEMSSFPPPTPLGADLCFRLCRPSSAIELHAIPQKWDIGEKAGWTVTLAQDAGVPVSKYSYVIQKNNLEVIQEGTLDFSAGAASIETVLDEPAMLYVEVTLGGTTIHLGAAIAPEKLQPSVPRPADFDSFWDAKLKSLSEIPINPVLTPVPTSRAGMELYTVKLDSFGSHVQGYLAKPSKEGKFPALVIFQYAGVYALRPETVTDRAAEGWLAFDVDSHDMPPSEATGASKAYQSIGNTGREQCYFSHMYLA